MLTLKTEDIPEEGLNLQWEEDRDSLLAYMGNFSHIDFDFEAPLQATIRVWKTGKSVLIKGQVKTLLRMKCGRCLKEFLHPLSSAIDLTLFPMEGASFEEEVELERQDMEANFFEKGEIHVSEIACEQILLEIPYQPLCQEGCKGLCPVCGNDLNLSSCGCSREEMDSGFSKLKDLKLN